MHDLGLDILQPPSAFFLVVPHCHGNAFKLLQSGTYIMLSLFYHPEPLFERPAAIPFIHLGHKLA